MALSLSVQVKSACLLVAVLTRVSRAECEERLRAEFRIELNAAIAEGDQRWESREQELQNQLADLQSQVILLPRTEIVLGSQNLLHTMFNFVLAQEKGMAVKIVKWE